MERVVIVEGNPVIREGLRSILADSQLEVVGVAVSGAQAVERVQALAPDVILLDNEIAAAHDYGALKAIRRVSPAAIVVFILRGDGASLFEAVAYGACSYIANDISQRSLVLAVDAALAGYILADRTIVQREVSAVVGRRLAGSAQPVENLTPREREVLSLMSEGLTNCEIAEQLTVTVGTVKSHVSSILRKLQVSDRVRAIVWAREHSGARLEPGQSMAL